MGSHHLTRLHSSIMQHALPSPQGHKCLCEGLLRDVFQCTVETLSSTTLHDCTLHRCTARSASFCCAR